MNEEFNNLDFVQGRGDFQGLPVVFPELGIVNRGMLHRPTVGGLAQAGLIALDYEGREEATTDSAWNDPIVIQDYLNQL